MGVKYDDMTIRIWSPLVVGRKGEYYQILYDLLGKGYVQVKVDGAD
jgi:excinuclease UvrABC ATPase subunit